MFQTDVVKKFGIHIIYSITSPESCAVYDMMWRNTVETDRPQMILSYGTCWVTEATHTHTQNILLSLELVVVQMRLSALHYAYLASFVPILMVYQYVFLRAYQKNFSAYFSML
jgi:hypothetical protein